MMPTEALIASSIFLIRFARYHLGELQVPYFLTLDGCYSRGLVSVMQGERMRLMMEVREQIVLVGRQAILTCPLAFSV